MDDQHQAPILEGLEAYQEAKTLPFTIPAHKQGKSIDEDAGKYLGSDVYKNNIYLISGIDDRLETHHRIARAEKLAAQAFGAEMSLYSVAGSSFSSRIALLSVIAPGEEILIGRNCHKSLIAGLILAGAKPVYMRPHVNEVWETIHSVTPEQVARTLEDHPTAKAVFITSPDYFGGVADVTAIAKICHVKGIPLVVDEAWGGHFHFHPDYPPSAMQAGADMSFASMHKTMSALMQGGIINVQGTLISKDKVNLNIINYETTSLNSLIYASCDASRRHMALHGKELLTKVLTLSTYAREQLSRIPELTVLEEEILSVPGVVSMDKAKIFIDTTKLGVSGFAATDYLEQVEKVTLEVCTHRHIMPIITIADTQETVDRLLLAIKHMVAWAKQQKGNGVPQLPPLSSIFTSSSMLPRDAFYAKTAMKPLAEAVGFTAAEIVTPYPPGIPILAPGEVVTAEICNYIQEGVKHGMYVESLDPDHATIRVVLPQ